MEKIAFTKNTQVITSAFDDGSCHILDQEVEKLCYNQFTGVNYLIKKEKMHEKCSFQPTRLHFTEGQFLTGKSKSIVFLSDKEKSVFQLGKQVEICGCKRSWQTNYRSLYLRDTQNCSVISATMLPPSAINEEHSINLKLDYILFKSENTSRVFYKEIFNELSDIQIKNFMHLVQIAYKVKEVGLIEIAKPIFARYLYEKNLAFKHRQTVLFKLQSWSL